MQNLSEQLTASLQAEADFFDVVVQVVEAPDKVYLYLNRPPTLEPDCPQLLKVIKARLRQDFPHLSSIFVASRIIGNEQPDWSQDFVLQEPTLDFLQEEIEVPESVTNEPAQPEIKLSSFCFSRNRQLVEGDIDKPSKEVKKRIKAFHDWEREHQIRTLQFLKGWFNDAEANQTLHGLPSEAQELIQAMTADRELHRAMKVWLSRYCWDVSKTLTEVSDESFSQPHKVSKTEKSTHSQSRAGGQTPSPTRSGKSGSTPLPKNRPSRSAPSSEQLTNTSQAFSTDELPMILITAVIAGVCAWLLSGAVSTFGGLGIFLAVVSIVAGFMGALQEKVIGGICGIILIIFWVLLPGFLVLWFEILGGAIGFVTAMSMQQATAKGGTLFSPKPLRILLAVAVVVTLIQGHSIWQWNSGGGSLSASRGVPLAEYKATGEIVLAGKSTPMKGGLAVLEVDRENQGVFLLHVAFTPRQLTSADIDVLKKSRSSLEEIRELDLRSDPEQPQVASAIMGIIYINNQPQEYVISVLHQTFAQTVGGGLSYSQRTFDKIGKPNEGLTISEFDPKEGGKLKLSIKTAVNSEITVNLAVDTKLFVR
jgi:hypothetical protein